jgi:hypothetical protein
VCRAGDPVKGRFWRILTNLDNLVHVGSGVGAGIVSYQLIPDAWQAHVYVVGPLTPVIIGYVLFAATKAGDAWLTDRRNARRLRKALKDGKRLVPVEQHMRRRYTITRGGNWTERS